MRTVDGITLERNGNGSITAYWTDSEGYLCRNIYIDYTKREALSLARQERRERNQKCSR